MYKALSVVEKLSKVMGESIHRHGWSFSMQGEQLSAEEVVSETGFLPLLLEMAAQNAAKATGDKWTWPSQYFYDPPA